MFISAKNYFRQSFFSPSFQYLYRVFLVIVFYVIVLDLGLSFLVIVFYLIVLDLGLSFLVNVFYVIVLDLGLSFFS